MLLNPRHPEAEALRVLASKKYYSRDDAMTRVNQDSGTKLNDRSMSYFPHCYDQNLTEGHLEYSWLGAVPSLREGMAAR